MRLFETLISIPLLVLALLAIAAAGPKASGSSLLLIGVVVLVYAPRIARMARAVAVDLVTRDYVTVARARGESVRSIVWRELTPNAAGVLLVEFGVRAGYAPILISSLGFLGFGARPPSPEWGLMISENRAALVDRAARGARSVCRARAARDQPQPRHRRHRPGARTLGGADAMIGRTERLTPGAARRASRA